MPDVEGYVLIVNGATQIVGAEVLETGVISSGPGAGNMLFASETAIRSNNTVVSASNPLPVADTAAETSLATIASGQSAGTTSLATIATAQGAAGNGISQPTGGSGVIGFLSGIFQKLTSGLTTSDGGTPAAGVNQPAGGVGLSGWLSGIYAAITGTQLTKSGVLTIVPLDNAATGAAGAAVNILNAGHVTAGGYFIPITAGGNVSLIGNAGTLVGGNNIPVGVGQAFVIAPNAGAVSFVSTTGTVELAGYGYQ